jgi:hypothetical protein
MPCAMVLWHHAPFQDASDRGHPSRRQEKRLRPQGESKQRPSLLKTQKAVSTQTQLLHTCTCTDTHDLIMHTHTHTHGLIMRRVRQALVLPNLLRFCCVIQTVHHESNPYIHAHAHTRAYI